MINQLGASNLITDKEGRMTQNMRVFTTQVTESALIIGAGSPETVVPANQGRFYMDETGLTGSVFFIKQLTGIGGDNKQGWVAIG